MEQWAYMIDTPAPFEPPAVWWAFLRSLRDLDQNDLGVQDAKQHAIEHLAWVSEDLPFWDRLARREAKQSLSETSP